MYSVGNRHTTFADKTLQLFYGKRSQFVYGKEAEVATVSVGRSVSRDMDPVRTLFLVHH